MISSWSHKGGHFAQVPSSSPSLTPGFGPRAAESRSWDDGQLSSWTTYNEASRHLEPRPDLALPSSPLTPG